MSVDLSALDHIDPEILARLPPFFQRVYRALKAIEEEGEDGR